MKYSELIKFMEQENKYPYHYIVNNNGKRQLVRLFMNNNTIYKFCPHSSRRGYPISEREIDGWLGIKAKKIKSDLELARCFFNKVIKYLDASGLWEDIKLDFEKMSKLDDDILNEYLNSEYYDARKIENKYGFSSHVDDLATTINKGIKYIKYPTRDTYTRKLVSDSISSKEKLSLSWVNGYDNSIFINKNDATNELCMWYSEEYKGCGNGHYYIAIDSVHAIFCEND